LGFLPSGTRATVTRYGTQGSCSVTACDVRERDGRTRGSWGPLDREQKNDGFGSVHFLDAAVMATGARHCAFERCRVNRSGGYGIYLIDGSSYTEGGLPWNAHPPQPHPSR